MIIPCVFHLFNDYFVLILYIFHFLGPARSPGSSAMATPMCHICKLRKCLGRRGGGCGFEPRWWHITVIVRMCNSIAFYAFRTLTNDLICPILGLEHGSLTPQLGRLTTSKSSHLEIPLFLAMIRKSETICPQLWGPIFAP